jgi:hypothetical protein
MAVEYLATNATSLAAGNWKVAAGTAGSGIASGDNTYIIPDGSLPIVSNMDFSGLAEGIAGFQIGAGRTGDIGTATTPLKIDVDNSSTSTFLNRGSQGTLYYQAAGDDNLCQVFKQAGTGRTTFVGGTITTLQQSLGHFEATESAVVTNISNYGGGMLIRYNSTALTSLNIHDGPRRSITLMRAATINLYGGATVILDVEGTSTPAFTINMFSPSAVVRVLRADTMATVNQYAGMIDLQSARRAVTLGGTAYIRGPRSRLLTDDRHTVATAVWVGGTHEIGGPSGAGI